MEPAEVNAIFTAGRATRLAARARADYIAAVLTE